jgi:hypothetical protein
MIEHYVAHIEGMPVGKTFLQIGVSTSADLADAVDKILAEMGWDQPHTMFAVYRHDDTFAVTDVPMPAPFRAMPPHIGFPSYARAAWRQPEVRASLAPYFTEKFYGWLIAFEGWGVSIGPDTSPQDRARLERARRDRTFHEQPDRVESRFLVLAGPEGETIQVSRERGTNGAEDLVRRMDDANGTFVDATRRYADLGARVQFLRDRAQRDSRG